MKLKNDFVWSDFAAAARSGSFAAALAVFIFVQAADAWVSSGAPRYPDVTHGYVEFHKSIWFGIVFLSRGENAMLRGAWLLIGLLVFMIVLMGRIVDYNIRKNSGSRI